MGPRRWARSSPAEGRFLVGDPDLIANKLLELGEHLLTYSVKPRPRGEWVAPRGDPILGVWVDPVKMLYFSSALL